MERYLEQVVKEGVRVPELVGDEGGLGLVVVNQHEATGTAKAKAKAPCEM